MRALRTRIDALTTTLLDELAERGQPADLHAAVGVPLPILVICELLGVPYEDRDQFRGWTADPTVFGDPDRVDIGRPGPAHLSFGHGARYCLGAPLARIELHAVFSQLVTRFPTLHLAVDPAELTLRRDVLTGGLTGLPVRW